MRAGRLIAQADHIPIHLGAMIGAVEAILARYSLDDMQPGDAFICNDPYLAGGSHLPDISIITPVHHEGVVRFFCGNIAHHADVGGRTPGLDLRHLALDLRGRHPPARSSASPAPARSTATCSSSSLTTPAIPRSASSI